MTNVKATAFMIYPQPTFAERVYVHAMFGKLSSSCTIILKKCDYDCHPPLFVMTDQLEEQIIVALVVIASVASTIVAIGLIIYRHRPLVKATSPAFSLSIIGKVLHIRSLVWISFSWSPNLIQLLLW
jgi:hypothetical protein